MISTLAAVRIGGGIQAAQGNNNVQMMTNHTAACNKQTNLAETAQRNPKLLQKLEQANPTTTTIEKMTVVAEYRS
ncbi:hypothetical protein [Nostoc sp.]